MFHYLICALALMPVVMVNLLDSLPRIVHLSFTLICWPKYVLPFALASEVAVTNRNRVNTMN